jgi:hypothetical protein
MQQLTSPFEILLDFRVFSLFLSPIITHTYGSRMESVDFMRSNNHSINNRLECPCAASKKNPNLNKRWGFTQGVLMMFI